MRIALLHPTYWPEVRRGSERLIHDLGVMLAGRGHEVTLLTAHPAPRSVSVEEGVRIVRNRRFSQPPMLGLHERFLGNVHNVARELLRGDFDIAHAFFPSDAWAAVKMRRLGGPPVVFSLHGIPTRRYLVNRRYRLEMLQSTIRGAAACTVLSRTAAAAFERFLLHEPEVLPGGVLSEVFASQRSRAAEPTLLFASSAADPRKRAELAFEGFQALRARRPQLRLLVVRTPDPEYGILAPELPEGAEWIDAPATEELAEAYAHAWLTIFPALDEAFGLVSIESLAAGTPVVAARSGGCPEIVDSDELGRLFEPDDVSDLERALEETLSLAERENVRGACQARAAEYDWSRIVERYEALYDEVAGRPADWGRGARGKS